MYRPVLIGCVLFTLFGVLNSHVSGNICTKVKEEFSKISEEDLVPYLPIIGKFYRSTLLITPSRVDLSVCCQSSDQRATATRSKENWLIEF